MFEKVWSTDLLTYRGMLPDAAAALDAEARSKAVLGLPGMMAQGPGMATGFLVSLVTAIGPGALQLLAQPASLSHALRHAVIACAGFAMTTEAYDYVYAGASRSVFLIKIAHYLAAYLAGAAVIYLIDARKNPATS